MTLISIDLTSDFGFFKNPQYNGEKNNKQYSFDTIHKIAILGILGNMLGLNGLKSSKSLFPDFYTKLSKIKIGIEVLNEIDKTWLSTNSSTGLFSKSTDGGNNLIISKHVIIKPKYRIYILLNLDDKVDSDIYEHLKNNKIPYFGDIYFGSSKFPAIKENFTKYDNFVKLNKYEGVVKTIFSSNYKLKTSRRNRNVDNVYNLEYLFNNNTTKRYERDVSIPTSLTELSKGTIGYSSFENFNLTNKEVIIEDVSGEVLYELNNNGNYAICLH